MKILIVVDMQNDFIDGSLGSEDACKIVKSVSGRIAEAKKDGYEIIVTLDTHGKDYLDTPEGKALPVPHCIKGSEGHRLNSLIAEVVKGCKVYEKPTFGSKQLFEDMEKEKPDEIEFIGLCTDICVVSNAIGLKAFLPNAHIVVNSKCCAGTSRVRHEAALETMRSCQIEVK